MSTSLEFQPMTDHIYRLNMSFKPFSWLPMSTPVAVFLIADENSKYYLVDTAGWNMEHQIAGALAKFFDKDTEKAAVNELDAILITHFHSDHTGSLRALWEMTESQIPVYAHDEDIAFIQENKKIYEQKSKSFSFTLGKNLMKLFPEPKLQVPCNSIAKLMHCSNPSTSSANEPQQETSTNNEAPSSSAQLPHSNKVHFYHCPGHTPGSCCFYHVEDQALICGDVFMNNTGKLGDSIPMATPDPVGSRQNAIEMCKMLDFSILLPSHDISEKGVSKETVVKHLKL